MINLRMKLDGAIIPTPDGVTITLVPVDNANSGGLNGIATPFSIRISDPALGARLTLGDVLNITLEPNGDLQRDIYEQKMAAENGGEQPAPAEEAPAAEETEAPAKKSTKKTSDAG